MEHLDPTDLETVGIMATEFKQADIHWILTTSSKEVYESCKDIHDHVFYAQKWEMHKWINCFSMHNITVWHALQQLPSWWRQLIQKGMAMQIDHEPVWVCVG